MLGSDVCSVLAEGHDVLAYDIDDFDIGDVRETVRMVDKSSPDMIVHAAAFTDVEACETERARAYRTNVEGTGNLVHASRNTGCPLIYLSTDYVFDGTKRQPYRESDAPSPLNYYGLTKLEGEKLVRGIERFVIVRTSWLFGPKGRNFVDRILTRASAGEKLRVVDDQAGCPTYTWDLATALKAVIESGFEGVIHLTNSGSATWFELATVALRMAGLDAEVEPVPSASYVTKARRPAYSVLASDVAEHAGIEPLPHWRHGVRDHLRRRGMLKSEALL
jgi:dTDP-4-dehydrorhamnose reductase